MIKLYVLGGEAIIQQAVIFKQHDVKMNHYGTWLASCSSDGLIKLFKLSSTGEQEFVCDLKGHKGPVWQVDWAHPKFGKLLASCSYDRKVIVWKEVQENHWEPLYESSDHESSVNSISWAPHELGLMLACASSDSTVSVITCKQDGTWDSQKWQAHQIGCNAVSWAPALPAGSMLKPEGTEFQAIKRIASGGCDNLVKIWRFAEMEGAWKLERTLEAHNDWVRDVMWSPGLTSTGNTLASCGQDKAVYIWTEDENTGQWSRVQLPLFPETVWRVSWSVSGANILAVSCGDQKISLFKETLEGEWKKIQELKDGQMGQ